MPYPANPPLRARSLLLSADKRRHQECHLDRLYKYFVWFQRTRTRPGCPPQRMLAAAKPRP